MVVTNAVLATGAAGTSSDGKSSSKEHRRAQEDGQVEGKAVDFSTCAKQTLGRECWSRVKGANRGVPIVKTGRKQKEPIRRTDTQKNMSQGAREGQFPGSTKCCGGLRLNTKKSLDGAGEDRGVRGAGQGQCLASVLLSESRPRMDLSWFPRGWSRNSWLFDRDTT